MDSTFLEAIRAGAEKLTAAIDQQVTVCKRSCNECLFTKNKIVSDARKAEVLEDCERDHTHFICHKASLAGKDIICAGFYLQRTTPFLEIMKQTGRVLFIEPTDITE